MWKHEGWSKRLANGLKFRVHQCLVQVGLSRKMADLKQLQKQANYYYDQAVSIAKVSCDTCTSVQPCHPLRCECSCCSQSCMWALSLLSSCWPTLRQSPGFTPSSCSYQSELPEPSSELMLTVMHQALHPPLPLPIRQLYTLLHAL